MKRVLLAAITFFLMTILFSCKIESPDGLSVVTTNFPAYDFAKNIIGDNGTVTLLLPPGGESHTYEPTAKDIILISECDLFIYNGGESDTWVDDLIDSLDRKPLVGKMMDYVDIHHSDDHGNHHHTDEHIWTSLKNSVQIISGLSKLICNIDSGNKDEYIFNATQYTNQIKKLDSDFEELFKNSESNTIVVADRFPFTHFADDYNLEYYSAYHSCSEDAEPTPKIIAELIDTVNKENIPLIFYIEFSNKNVATAVSEDTGVPMRELHSCHNITKKQLDDNVTYLDIMKKNFNYIKEAVN